MKIFVSAGHTPVKPGACHEGFCEYDEAVRWADLLVELLEGRMWVFRVPTGDVTTKTEFINIRSNNKDLALEIHFNSAAMTYHKQISGTETLYYPTSSRGMKYAKSIHTVITTDLGLTKDRGVKEGWYQQNKAAGRTIYFLRKTNCTSLILEPEFIQNRELIQSIREPFCEAIADYLSGYNHMAVTA